MKKIGLVRSAISALCALALLHSPNAFAAGKKILVVTVTKGFRHSSIPTAEAVIAGLADRTGDFSVDYVRNDEEMAAKMTPQALKAYDGVVFANTTGDLPLPDRDGFMAWLKSGKAFVGMHSASDTFHGYPTFIEMIGGEFQTHGPQVEVTAVNQDRHHPACQHYGSDFRVFDEIYILKSFHRSRVHGLLTQDKHPNTGLPGDYPIAWCSQYGKGKVFYTSLGHREDIWTSDHYQTHILGGLRWALGLAEGDATPQSTAYQVSKAEQKEGFRPLFNGVSLDGWKLRKADGMASWTVQNGHLVNTVKEGEHGTDILTEETFRDFTVRYEMLVPKGSNSGFYLRGRHEIQVYDDYGKKPAMGGSGAIYSVKPVDLPVSRKAGEWQNAEVTIRGQRVTAYLNGVKIHDNVEVNKATGGELDGHLSQPGPILLQGDHGSVAFRKLRIKVLD